MTKESFSSNIWRVCDLMRSDDGTPKWRRTENVNRETR
jgi:hypothetical protein